MNHTSAFHPGSMTAAMNQSGCSAPSPSLLLGKVVVVVTDKQMAAQEE
jgi:hypothetical protein